MPHLQIRGSLLALSFLENQQSWTQLPPITRVSGIPAFPPAPSTLRIQESGTPRPPSSRSSSRPLLSQDSEVWAAAPSVSPVPSFLRHRCPGSQPYSPQDPEVSGPRAHLGFPVTAHVSTSVSPSLTTAWEAWIRAVGESVGRSEMREWLSGSSCRLGTPPGTGGGGWDTPSPGCWPARHLHCTSSTYCVCLLCPEGSAWFCASQMTIPPSSLRSTRNRTVLATLQTLPFSWLLLTPAKTRPDTVRSGLWLRPPKEHPTPKPVPKQAICQAPPLIHSPRLYFSKPRRPRKRPTTPRVSSQSSRLFHPTPSHLSVHSIAIY